jgi:acyl-CoA thioesterase-1
MNLIITISFKILLFGLFSYSYVLAQNTPPEIKKFIVVEKEQGEEGVLQTIVRAVAVDKEDGKNLKYTYRILSGSGSLSPINRYAIFTPEKADTIWFEVVVTDQNGESTGEKVRYIVDEIDPKKLYTDLNVWRTAIGGKFRKHPSFSYQDRNPDLPNVLIIGNSISIGYTSYVQKLLREKCNVHRIPANGGDTRNCLKNFNFWIGDNNWDVIHFNFGMHDFKRIVNNKLDIKGDNVVGEKEYRKNLATIVSLLNNTGAKLIWATSSVVPEGAEGRIKGEEVHYNKIAMDVMESDGQILIDDQYKLTAQYPKDQRTANVHFFNEGKERQAAQVAKSILKALDK